MATNDTQAGDEKMTVTKTMQSASMAINGCEMRVQCLIPSQDPDPQCPDITSAPVVADLAAWDPRAIESRANEIAESFGCRKGDAKDAAWCLAKMDADSDYSKIYRVALTESQREEMQSAARRSALRGDL